ncbi:MULTISPECIES: hypothetical protein [unclassified Variovorax]|uniref:hypothetical protein n=1 Tax=unclassified Variovorax TaxID=663243 RepID=UPI00076D4CAD|nr:MULTISPECIES: hypothetical protein [unclassified Variovorax]KWT70814.1 hypothetical protein APY03_6570 [Variovorax sp. WDL1]
MAIRLFHGTTEQFDAFDTSCMLGAHFGTAAAAEARLRDVAGGQGEVREYEITFQNALEIVDLGTWKFPSVLRELRSKGVLSAAQVDAAYEANNRSDAAGSAFVKDALRAAGYDALRYSNLVEDAGSESFIVLEAEQITPCDDNASRPSMCRP